MILFIIGRLLFGGYFLLNGYNHFAGLSAMSEAAKTKDVPWPKAAVIISGILLLLGGSGMILGIYVPLAALALILFLIPVTFKMHAYWRMTDPGERMVNKINFAKNLALLGADLMILFIPLPWPYSL